jgi:2'-5' RNA ligase superfamily
MEDFWGPLRGRWPTGAPVLHWHILPGSDPALAAFVSAYRGLTVAPGLDAVPARWLHQTLYLVGQAADPAAGATGGPVFGVPGGGGPGGGGPGGEVPGGGVTGGEVAQMVRYVRAAARLWAPMRVTYGPAAVERQSVTLRVSPAEPAAQLHGAVVAAAAAVLGGRAAVPPQAPYWGHLTIAYANASIDDGPLLGWLGAHPVEPVTITVRAIHLVRQSCQDRLFAWAPAATVPLGSPS